MLLKAFLNSRGDGDIGYISRRLNASVNLRSVRRPCWTDTRQVGINGNVKRCPRTNHVSYRGCASSTSTFAECVLAITPYSS